MELMRREISKRGQGSLYLFRKGENIGVPRFEMVSEVNPARVEIVSELNQSEVNCTLFET